MLDGVDLTDSINYLTYDSYTKGKARGKPYSTLISPRKAPLNLVYSDIIGPITPEGFRKEQYLIIFRDDFTKIIIAIPINNKSDALTKY